MPCQRIWNRVLKQIQANEEQEFERRLKALILASLIRLFPDEPDGEVTPAHQQHHDYLSHLSQTFDLDRLIVEAERKRNDSIRALTPGGLVSGSELPRPKDDLLTWLAASQTEHQEDHGKSYLGLPEGE